MNNKDKNRVISFLGLAARAGKIVSGDDSTLLELKRGNVHLVIISEDASKNTKKLFTDKAGYRNVKLVEFGSKEEIGHAIGKSYRAVIGIKDKGFASKISEILEEI